MSVLGRREILALVESGELVVRPFTVDAVRENGLDLALGGEYCVARRGVTLDLRRPVGPGELFDCYRGDGGILVPANGRVLAHTVEYLRLPGDVVGFVGIRSSYARLGLAVPFTVVDAGFEGQVVVELLGSAFDVVLRPGERLVHLVLARAEGAEAYAGAYTGQTGVRHSKLLTGAGVG